MGNQKRSGLFRRRAATGGEEKPEWHADAVPKTLRVLRGEVQGDK